MEINNSLTTANSFNSKRTETPKNSQSQESIPDSDLHTLSNTDLSEEIKAAETEAMIRHAKIKEVRDAIEEGRFPLDARKIAENFAELERLL